MNFTPDSAFWSLEVLGYTTMSAAALFTVPILTGGRMQDAIRWLFALNSILSISAAVAYILTANPLHVLVLASLGLWSVAFPIATILLAFLFKRAERLNGLQQNSTSGVRNEQPTQPHRDGSAIKLCGFLARGVSTVGSALAGEPRINARHTRPATRTGCEQPTRRFSVCGHRLGVVRVFDSVRGGAWPSSSSLRA
jgi:hypothetical protein